MTVEVDEEADYAALIVAAEAAWIEAPLAEREHVRFTWRGKRYVATLRLVVTAEEDGRLAAFH